MNEPEEKSFENCHVTEATEFVSDLVISRIFGSHGVC